MMKEGNLSLNYPNRKLFLESSININKWNIQEVRVAFDDLVVQVRNSCYIVLVYYY